MDATTTPAGDALEADGMDSEASGDFNPATDASDAATGSDVGDHDEWPALDSGADRGQVFDGETNPDGCALFGQPSYYEAPGSPSSMSVAYGDFDEDGVLDLVAVVGPQLGGPVVTFPGRGDGTFRFGVSYGVPGGADFVRAVDFNGDRHLDLAVTMFGGSFVVLIGNGDGTFRKPVSYPTGTGSAGMVAVADVNGDGNMDAVCAESDGLSLLLGNGDGTLEPPVILYTRVVPSGEAIAVAIADLNGDLKLDLAVANSPGPVSILLGNGDGTFQSVVNYAAGSGPDWVATGDFNGDGTLDLAVAAGSSYYVNILLGRGDGTFRAPVGYYVGTPGSVVVADYDRDGKLDLAAAASVRGTEALVLRLGNGDGTFQPPVDLPPVGSVEVAADFNGDGLMDLAGPGLPGGTVVVRLNTGCKPPHPGDGGADAMDVGAGG